MPLNYSNLAAITVSEAQRTWDTAQDWTIHGLNTLTLHVRGRAENNPMRLYLTVKDSTGRNTTVVHPDANAVTTIAWQEWAIPFSVLAPVDLTQVSTLIIGLGNRTSPISGTGLIYVDDIRVQAAK
jgi:hypothetical protein